MKKNYLFTSCAMLLTLVSFLCACKKDKNEIEGGITYGITGIEPAAAGAGDTVRIYGAGFNTGNDGNTVKINGVAAKVIAASADVLQIIVPVAPRSGVVSVQTGSDNFSYDKGFSVATVITGDRTASETWGPGQLYLLKGDTHFKSGTTLTINAGTTILADKATTPSLIIDDGASVAMNGTASQPIVFTSNQLTGFRQPGDWMGITLSASATANDVMNYVRVEYAGYHSPNIYGAGLQITRSTAAGNIQNVQVSYSGGDGFRFNSGANSVQYMKYLVAFGCAGNDFTYTNNVRAYAQYLLGLKDPLYADQYEADGMLVQSAQPVTISNLSLMGYNGLARNALPSTTTISVTTLVNDDVMNANAGRGLHIGNAGSNGTVQLFNSLIAAPWLAGISLDGVAAWNQYENGGSIIRNTSVTYTLASPTNSVRRVAGTPPFRGYSFSRENVSRNGSGFEQVTGSVQKTAFVANNDTLRLMLLPVPTNSVALDDLGVGGMALYSRITNPLMLPTAGSAILKNASFTNTALNDAFFDKSQQFRGAFGATDWTRPWANYVPQQTSYQ